MCVCVCTRVLVTDEYLNSAVIYVCLLIWFKKNVSSGALACLFNLMSTFLGMCYYSNREYISAGVLWRQQNVDCAILWLQLLGYRGKVSEKLVDWGQGEISWGGGWGEKSEGNREIAWKIAQLKEGNGEIKWKVALVRSAETWQCRDQLKEGSG